MIYLSLMPYMPPPTSWNPMPHIYFLTWKTGGKQIHCLRFRGWKAVLQWHLVLCVVLYLLMWICVEIEDSTRRTISFEAASVWGVGVFPTLLSPDQWTGNHYPPTVCHVSLFTEKKYSSLFSPVHPEIHHPIPVYSYLSHQFPYPIHFHLKSTVLYIYYDYTRFFFTVNVFVLHPILFGSLLVALMWNVCAEPIECCVYIKATLFLTIPAFVVWVWLRWKR